MEILSEIQMKEIIEKVKKSNMSARFIQDDLLIESVFGQWLLRPVEKRYVNYRIAVLHRNNLEVKNSKSLGKKHKYHEHGCYKSYELAIDEVLRHDPIGSIMNRK